MEADEPEPKVEQHTTRIRELKLRVERGRQGINECQFKEECARASQCPGAC
jgi:hypothetical protein